MQHDHAVVVRDLVDQVGGPEHRDPVLARQAVDVGDDGLAGRHVQAHGRLVEQQQPRPVQQRAGDLDPAAVAAVEPAHPLARALGHAQAAELGLDARQAFGPAQAVQRGVVEQVLAHREVEIQRRLLEHHPHACQRPARVAAQFRALDPDLALGAFVEPGDQREQRGLAGPVGAQQHLELAGAEAHRDLVQRALAAEAETKSGDLEGGGRVGGHFCPLPAEITRQ